MKQVKWLDWRTQIADGVVYVRDVAQYRASNPTVPPVNPGKRHRTWIRPQSPMPGVGVGGFNIWGVPADTATDVWTANFVARDLDGRPHLLNPLHPALMSCYSQSALETIKLGLDFWAGSGVPFLVAQQLAVDQLDRYNFSDVMPELFPPLTIRDNIILVPGDLARSCGCTLLDDIVAIDYQEFGLAIRPPAPLVSTAANRVSTVMAIGGDSRYTAEQKCSAMLRVLTNYGTAVILT